VYVNTISFNGAELGCYCQSYSDCVDIHVLIELNSGAIVSVIVIMLICKFWFSLQGLQMYICLDVVDKVINGDCRDPINWFNPAQFSVFS
jgi:hypothetical protein